MVMRILVICDHAWVNGGQTKIAIDAAVGLANKGHEVTYFAPCGPVADELPAAGVRVVCLDQHDLLANPSRLNAALTGLWNREAAAALRKLLSEMPDDTIIHVHGWAKALSPSVAPVIEKSGKRLVYSVHEYFLVCPNGAFFRFNEQRNCNLKPMSLACMTDGCDQRNGLHKAWRVARHALLHGPGGWPRNLKHIIHQSDLQRDVLGALLPKDAVWHRVLNPIRAEDKGLPTEKDIDFLFVGRLSPEKGTLLLAEAARKADVSVTFVGDGYYRETLETEFPGVNVLGWKSPAEVIDHMRRARVLAFPSLWYEGYPLTIFESLANGTPVIVSDNCSGREAIEDGVTGLWFKGRDVNDLAAKLEQYKDRDTVAKASRAAYDRYWSAPLTPDAHVDGLERVFASI